MDEKEEIINELSYILEELDSEPEIEEYNENFDEDVNAKDDEELTYDELSYAFLGYLNNCF